MVFPSSKYYEPLMAEVLWTKDHNQSDLDEFSILYCDPANPTFSAWVIRKKCWALLDILICASTTQKVYVPWVVTLHLHSDHCLSIDSPEYVCIRSSMPIILVVRQAILFRMTRRNKLQYLVHFQDWVKVVVLCKSNANPAFALF